MTYEVVFEDFDEFVKAVKEEASMLCVDKYSVEPHRLPYESLYKVSVYVVLPLGGILTYKYPKLHFEKKADELVEKLIAELHNKLDGMPVYRCRINHVCEGGQE